MKEFLLNDVYKFVVEKLFKLGVILLKDYFKLSSYVIW